MDTVTLECTFCGRKYESDELSPGELHNITNGEGCPSDDCPVHDAERCGSCGDVIDDEAMAHNGRCISCRVLNPQQKERDL